MFEVETAIVSSAGTQTSLVTLKFMYLRSGMESFTAVEGEDRQYNQKREIESIE